MKALTIILIFLCTTAYAADLKLEPVYGFERTFQQNPKPSRYKTEVFVGVRGVYGTDLFAGELEINQGNSSYSVGDTDVKTNTQNFLVGLRLVPFAKEYYSIYIRGGMRAKKESRDISVNNTTTSETDAIQLDPYAGSGISLHVGGLFSLNASATLVYNRDAEASERYDSRYTFGASFKFGNR